MNIDNLIPLLFLYVFWRILSRQGTKGKPAEAPPPPPELEIPPEHIYYHHPRPESVTREETSFPPSAFPPGTVKGKSPKKTFHPTQKSPPCRHERKKGGPLDAVLSRPPLEQAVLWSEIIGPPVSLRPHDDSRAK